MKKLTTFATVVMLALGVVACDKKADPAVDYVAFQQWNQTQNTFQRQATGEFQQQLKAAAEAKDARAVSAAFLTYAGKVQETIKALDSVQFASDEMKATKEKIKNYLVITQELMTDNAKEAAAPSEEQRKAIAAKQQQAQALMKEAKAAQDALEAKYGKKQAQ